MSGEELDIAIIAHDSRIQKLFDEQQISWGVQYELARGITAGQWTWEAIETKISELKGPNAEVAYRIRNLMRDRDLRVAADLSIWYVSIPVETFGL